MENPRKYYLEIFAYDSDDLRTREVITTEAPSSLKITTNGNKSEFEVSKDAEFVNSFGDKYKPTKFSLWIFKVAYVRFTVMVGGLKKQVPDYQYLIDNNNDEWLYDRDIDMFYREINGKKKKTYTTKTMIEEIPNPQTFKFKYKAKYLNEKELIKDIIINIVE